MWVKTKRTFSEMGKIYVHECLRGSKPRPRARINGKNSARLFARAKPRTRHKGKGQNGRARTCVWVGKLRRWVKKMGKIGVKMLARATTTTRSGKTINDKKPVFQ